MKLDKENDFSKKWVDAARNASKIPLVIHPTETIVDAARTVKIDKKNLEPGVSVESLIIKAQDKLLEDVKRHITVEESIENGKECYTCWLRLIVKR